MANHVAKACDRASRVPTLTKASSEATKMLGLFARYGPPPGTSLAKSLFQYMAHSQTPGLRQGPCHTGRKRALGTTVLGRKPEGQTGTKSY
jgi:hypothetical protein